MGDVTEEELLKCKQAVFQELKEVLADVKNVAGRVDRLELGHDELMTTLKAHSQERVDNHKSLEEKFNKLSDWFKTHHEDEMDKYDKIVDSIQCLTNELKATRTETHDNTNFIEKLKKYWFGISMTVSTLLAFGAILWWIVIEMENRGLLILFPTGT